MSESKVCEDKIVASEDESDDEEPLSGLASRLPAGGEQQEESEDAEEQNESQGEPEKKRRRRKKKRFLLNPVRPRRPGPKQKTTVDSVVKEEEPEAEPVIEDDDEYKLPTADRLRQYTPQQMLLDHILRIFEQKDPEEYFIYPVTEDIAPDYRAVIKLPMDLLTIRRKVDKNEYQSFDEFKIDADLICANAMEFNKVDTIYHQAAKKLQIVIKHYISPEYVQSIYDDLPFVPDLDTKFLGFDPAPLKPQKKLIPMAGHYKCIVDDASVGTQSKSAAEKVKTKLANRKADTHLAFLRKNESGYSTLNILTPELVADKGDDEKKGQKVLRMGDLVGKVRQGFAGLPTFNEHPTNMHVPVDYLDYGAYASFAPQYDSTWSSLSKQESDLLMRTYGEREGAAYAHSLRSFVKDNAYLTKMVDSLLDTFTSGEHSKSLEQMGEEDKTEVDRFPVDFKSLKSLADLGINVSYLDQIEKEHNLESTVPDTVSQKLSRSAQILRDLRTLQEERLSKPPNFTLTKTDGPGIPELQTASSAVNCLSGLIKNVDCADLVDAEVVRTGMGVVDPNSDNIDMDLFNEFFQS